MAPARLRRPLRRTLPIDLNATVEPIVGALVAGLLIAIVILFVLAFWVLGRVRSIDARLRDLTRGEGGGSLEAVLDAHLDKVYAVARQVDELEVRTAVLEAASRKAFSRVGLVRYNPFEETGGNQSFAMALLDANGDGWVLSSLHARSGTRVYAKAIAGGRSETALSEEESAALRQATS